MRKTQHITVITAFRVFWEPLNQRMQENTLLSESYLCSSLLCSETKFSQNSNTNVAQFPLWSTSFDTPLSAQLINEVISTAAKSCWHQKGRAQTMPKALLLSHWFWCMLRWARVAGTIISLIIQKQQNSKIQPFFKKINVSKTERDCHQILLFSEPYTEIQHT